MYFNQFLELLDNCIDLKNIFCTRIITSPIANSTADKTKKKNVRESKFTLSYRKPMNSTNKYKVIQSNSAVNSNWRALDGFTTKLANKRKNISKNKLVSPININYNITQITLYIKDNKKISIKKNSKTKLKNRIQPSLVR